MLWRSTRDASFSGGVLVIRGSQLDGPGTFRQSFTEALPFGYWPSHVVVPNAGCWLFAVRIGGLQGAAGILVARVIDVP